jgi:hypothetical protein
MAYKLLPLVTMLSFWAVEKANGEPETAVNEPSEFTP